MHHIDIGFHIWWCFQCTQQFTAVCRQNNAKWRPSLWEHNNKKLTSGWLVAVVSMSKVLRILYHRNTSHPYDNRIRTSIQSTGGNNPMVDMMKRAGRVFLATDHSYWAWKDRDIWLWFLQLMFVTAELKHTEITKLSNLNMQICLLKV